jgi:hypothetical protein
VCTVESNLCAVYEQWSRVAKPPESDLINPSVLSPKGRYTHLVLWRGKTEALQGREGLASGSREKGTGTWVEGKSLFYTDLMGMLTSNRHGNII